MAESSGQQITPELYRTIIAIVDERVGELRVTREEYDQLRAAIGELVKAQAKTEARLSELAEAQKRTEARLASLAERVEELAEAQKKTEEILQGVIREQKNMKKEIGGLSATIGYTLENRAISKLPQILERDFGIHIDLMDRRFIEYPNGQEEEINIYGEGRSNGDLIYIIGESKSQLGKKDVDKFFKRLGRLSSLFRGKIIPVLVTHLVRPKVERYALEKIEGLLIYKSFQLED